FKDWDVHSPFPIHGLDGAMGLKKSSLSWFVFIGGATGTLTAFLLQFVTQVLIYPTFVQDKPANIGTLPAFFPVMFELTVLFSAFTALFGSMILNRLPRWNHPLFESEQFGRFSDDAFFLCIEARDPQFSKDETLKMLKDIGGKSIELIEDDI
ncbi:DUF3341 domain-containing protein, partial [Verrucomicrobiales bacterium]|nr:DUF3341 domain-containing protein [Verrucomicrobiales bacterium]